MDIAVITGASSGIGLEFVREIVKDASLEKILVVARREDRLLELRKEFGERIVPVAADIVAAEGVEKVCAAIAAASLSHIKTCS